MWDSIRIESIMAGGSLFLSMRCGPPRFNSTLWTRLAVNCGAHVLFVHEFFQVRSTVNCASSRELGSGVSKRGRSHQDNKKENSPP